jgi:RHS repeat-associated protein
MRLADKFGPFGKPAISCQPIRLQGQYDDEETGLHYTRHRYYDPAVGQFISEDPIRLLGGLNLHAYAANTIGWVDPLGLNKKKKPFEKHQLLRDLPNPMRDAIADWLRAEWNKGGDARKAIKDAGRNLGAYLYDDGKLVVVLNVKGAVMHSEEVIAGDAGLRDFAEAGTLFSERVPCGFRCRRPIEGNDAIHDVLYLYPEKFAWGGTDRTWQEIQQLLANRYALIFNKHPADIVREFWHPELGKHGEFVCPDSA